MQKRVSLNHESNNMISIMNLYSVDLRTGAERWAGGECAVDGWMDKMMNSSMDGLLHRWMQERINRQERRAPRGGGPDCGTHFLTMGTVAISQKLKPGPRHWYFGSYLVGTHVGEGRRKMIRRTEKIRDSDLIDE